jgi:hypothetical protein
MIHIIATSGSASIVVSAEPRSMSSWLDVEEGN